MNNFETLRISSAEGVCRVTLSRPQFALSLQSFHELDELCERLEVDSSVRSVAFVGNAKVFAAGADLSEIKSMTPSEAEEHWELGAHIYDRIIRLPQISVASIAGHALGAGFLLALACDLRIAASNAKFGLPEMKLGIFPGMAGTVLLDRMAGPSVARALCLTGDIFDAQRAYALGIVHQVHSLDAIESETQELTRRLAGYSRAAAVGAKTALYASLNRTFIEAKESERVVYRGLFEHSDAHEGIAAFLGKRAPQFNRMRVPRDGGR
jgi:enoyl-CoA hydratase/carnithine racemase